MNSATPSPVSAALAALLVLAAMETCSATGRGREPGRGQTPEPKRTGTANANQDSGPSITPSETYAARTGEARGASRLRMTLQFTLSNHAQARRAFQKALGHLPEIVRFVVATHTTASLGTDRGRARLAQEIAENVNRQLGSEAVRAARIISLTLDPAG